MELIIKIEETKIDQATVQEWKVLKRRSDNTEHTLFSGLATSISDALHDTCYALRNNREDIIKAMKIDGRLWIDEFGLDYDVPQLVQDLVTAGKLIDVSWHNDVCPSFDLVCKNKKENTPTLWIDHPLISQREAVGYCRFWVNKIDQDDNLYKGDDLAAALKAMGL